MTTAADAQPDEVWQDSEGCCLTFTGQHWYAFGRTQPLDLALLPERDQPVRRLLTSNAEIAPERQR